MTTNFELAATFAPTLPLSLIAAVHPTSPVRKSKRPVRCAARAVAPAKVQPDVRMDLVNSLRRRIANGTYRVSAIQLADCMMNAIYA